MPASSKSFGVASSSAESAAVPLLAAAGMGLMELGETGTLRPLIFVPYLGSLADLPFALGRFSVCLPASVMTLKHWLPLALVVCALAASCTTVPMAAQPGAVASAPPQLPPLFVPAAADPNSDLAVNERAMDVLHYYNFEVDTNNQLEGTLATQYKVGSGIIEPWHRESIGMLNRLESTAQPIRRKVLIHFVRVEGGYLVSVEALKEIEDLASPTPNSPGNSTFRDTYPLQRDLNLVVGQSTPSGWLPRGHDVMLEQDILARLRAAYGCR
jgi:hypothetical protein